MSLSSRFMSLLCLRSSALTANQRVLNGWSEAEGSIVALHLELQRLVTAPLQLRVQRTRKCVKWFVLTVFNESPHRFSVHWIKLH
jgi:hypothetical protein